MFETEVTEVSLTLNLNEEFYCLSRTKRTMKVQFPAVITVIVTGNRP